MPCLARCVQVGFEALLGIAPLGHELRKAMEAPPSADDQYEFHANIVLVIPLAIQPIVQHIYKFLFRVAAYYSLASDNKGMKATFNAKGTKDSMNTKAMKEHHQHKMVDTTSKKGWKNTANGQATGYNLCAQMDGGHY
ncbi:hypothetical protein NMY22_g18963 [Coprinellus aureogranulatus]|nr:hypothetical protein NMY22_g18963 [Coprinellus aureogranulatus]